MKQRVRSEIDVKDTWDLTPIYKTDEEFLKDYNLFKKEKNEIEKYKGKILESSKTLLEFLKLSDKLERKLYRLYYYAHLNYDVDTTNSKSLEKTEMVSQLMTEYSSLKN